jgi:hypothetical protein
MSTLGSKRVKRLEENGGPKTEGANSKGRLKREDFEKYVTPSCLGDKAICKGLIDPVCNLTSRPQW